MLKTPKDTAERKGRKAEVTVRSCPDSLQGVCITKRQHFQRIIREKAGNARLLFSILLLNTVPAALKASTD